MKLDRSDSQPSNLLTSPLEDRGFMSLRTNSPRTTSASTTAPATSSTPMSVLYSVLLHAIASHSPVTKGSADHSLHSRAASCLHSSRPVADMDDSVREAVRAEVERLFPYGSAAVESTCVAGVVKGGPAQCFFGSAARGEEEEWSGCWGASVARVNAHGQLSELDAGNGLSSAPPPVTTVAVADAPSSSTTAKALKSVPKRHSRGFKMIKSLPSKKALAAVATAPAPAPSQPNPAEAPRQFSASPHRNSSSAGGVTGVQEGSSCRVPSAIADDTQRCAAVLATQLPDMQRGLEGLFDDFAAAIEQCSSALVQQQLRSSSRGAWQSAREKRGGLSTEPSVSCLEVEASDLQHPQRTPHRTITKHQRGNPTTLLTDVSPHRNAHRHVSDLTSPDYTPDEWGFDHDTTSTAKCNGCVSCAPIAGTESRGAVDGPAEQAGPSLVAESLPRGIVMIAHTIAEHLHTILHPTSTAIALEEEAVTALPGQGRGGSSGASEPTALLAATTTACQRSHSGAAAQKRRSTDSEFFACPPPSPALGDSRVLQPPPESCSRSPELWELRELVHSLLWARITALLSSTSLKAPDDSQPTLRSTAAVGQRETYAHVQLPFWIWLYAACGLATDVIRAQKEAQATSQVLEQVRGRCKQLASSSATTAASMPPPPSLSQLLPAVETLARQLQRRQYDRVQSTAETALTAHTFLSFTGVEMTDRAVMKRLFPSQSGAVSSDALGFAALSHHSARRTTHKANVATEPLSGSAMTGVFDTVAVPTLININTSLDGPISLRDCTTSTFSGTGTNVVDRSGSNGGYARGSSPQRGQGANGITAGDAGSPVASATREDAHQVHSGSHASRSTAELYLRWLERNDPESLAACSSRGEVKRFPDGAGSEAKGAGGVAASSCTSPPPPSRPDSGADTESYMPLYAADGEIGNRDADIAIGDGGSGRAKSSCAGCRCYTTAQRPSEPFRVAAVMPSADLAPCLGRVEKEMLQARSAVEFARKLGTLYATQDVNTLLPLLPAVAREEPVSPEVDLGSAHALDGALESLKSPIPPRRGTDDTSTPAAPAKPTGVVHPQCTCTGALVASNPITGGLPPLVVTPSQVGADRLPSNDAFLSCHHVATNAKSPVLFPPVMSPLMEQRLLMEHLNSCAAAIAPRSDQLFVDSARALELAFLLAVVLLSHVMSEAVPRGEYVSAERAIPATSSDGRIAPAVSATATVAKATNIVPRRPPSKAAAAAPSDRTEGKAAETKRAALPPPRFLSMDLAKVFGFSISRWRWQHLSAYVHETLITVALSALQRKDATVTQELLQCITLDTAIAHHDAQVRLRHPVSTPGAIKGAGKAKKAALSALKKGRNASKGSEGQVIHLWVPSHGSSTSFANVWFSSFACLVDTSTHLLQGDHSIPNSLKEAVWHLAGLAQYLLLTRDCGYDMYGGQRRLDSAALYVCGSGSAVDVDVRNSLAASNTALQNFITSQLVEPAGKVFGVVLTFMDRVSQALLSDMESGDAVARQRREGVIFVDDSSDDESLLLYPVVDDSVSPGGAGESTGLYRSDDGGGAPGINANCSETTELQTCWMELAVHYFLEIVDVLLDAALHLPEKPLYLYQLTVSASHTMTPSTDFADGVGTAGLAGVAGSPQLWGHGDLSNSVSATAVRVVADSPLDRVQEFLSMYTSMVLQSAVHHFTVDGRHAHFRAAITRATPSNVASAADGAPENDSSRSFWEQLLSSVAAPASSGALGDPPSARRQRPPSVPTPASVPATAAAANGVVSREAAAGSFSMRSTMWWPNAQFQRYSHLARIVEHAQLVSLYLNTRAGKDLAPTALAPSYLEAHQGPRDGAPSLQVSAVTALFNTSTGPCAQLLSIPYASPPSLIDNGCSSLAPGGGRTMSYERTGLQCTGSPVDQTPDRFPAIMHRRMLADRVMREVGGGLWIRVEVLRLLRLAAAPLDAATFMSFTTAATSAASQVQDKTMQTRYKALASIKVGTESVLPKTFASTYVRLLFLRYVQAFYADMRAVGASGRATAPDCTANERLEGTSSATPPTGFSIRGEVPPCRSLGSPRAPSPAIPFMHLNQLLWTQYCYELLWALRELCWSCAEAHETAASLSVASVFGRLLQMISGRGEVEKNEVIDDCGGEPVEPLLSESNSGLRDVGMPVIVALDCSLEQYSATEGFVDFELSSSDSSGMAVAGMREGCKPPPGQPQHSPASGESKCQRESSETAPRSSLSKSPTITGGQSVVKISDLTSVSDLTERRRLESNHCSISECTEVAERSARPLATSGTSLPAPPGLPVAPSAVLQLSLTGLKPPLYFTSSGDTAAAQENDFYKEQSKLRQIAEETVDRVLNAPSGAERDAALCMSPDDENDEECDVECEAILGNRVLTSQHTLPKPGSREAREAYPTASASTGAAAVGDAPRPPALTIPTLSLEAIDPPLYFTSTGDTGAFAERTITLPLPRSPASVFRVLNRSTPAAPAAAGAVHVDAAATGGPLKAATEATKVLTVPSPTSFSAPVLPSVTTTTVDGFVLPKLSLGSLGPPIYFTSTGDTGGFVEAQNQKPLAAAGAMKSSQSPSDVACLQAGSTVQSTASGRGVDTANAAAAVLTVSNWPKAATAAAHFQGGLPLAESNSDSGVSSLADFSPKGEKGSGGGHDRAEGGICHGWVSEHDAKGQRAAWRRGGSGSSLKFSSVPESGLPSLRAGQRRRKGVPRTSCPALTPIVAPAVTMELILSICSIILQQDSGMIQYAYTVSSLTQKRVLPGMSSTSQRRWHTGSGSATAAPGVTFTQNSDAAQTDRWRYTPQHSPSSFHVIQAMHNYLKDSRNSLVVDRLEEWVLVEYAEMERIRMERYELAYALSRHQEYSQQPLHPSSPHRASGGSIGSVMQPHCLHQPHTGATDGNRNGRPSVAMLTGRYVLLRLLLPRAITPLVTQQNERRIGAGGYGTVTSGFVQGLGTDRDTQLPPGWGQRGSRWLPAETRGSTAASGRGGGGGGGITAHSVCTGLSPATTGEGVAHGALDGLRAPWRTAVQRIAQAVCRCEVAIKHIPLNARGSESGNLPLCHVEVLAMYRLRSHPHIIPLISFDNTRDEYILVLPYYTQGSLRSWRQKHYPLGCAVFTLPPGMRDSRKCESTLAAVPAVTSCTPTPAVGLSSSLFATCARCLLQVLEAVTFMHDQHIRHGDIKCDNVLIASSHDSAKRGEMDPPMLPSSVRLCDFGSCDTCDDDDIQSLKHDIMAGETRFLAGRWGVGRGTEAIQPPELMSAKRRYTLLRRIMTATAPATAAALAPSCFLALSDRADRDGHTAGVAVTSTEHLPLRSRAGELMKRTGREVTELLRRAELSVDIWACGCLLYEMLTGRMLFGEARLGRLLVLAAVDDDQDQSPAAAASKANASAGPQPTLLHPLQKAAVPTKASVGGRDPGFSFTPSVSPKALDDWERRDLEAAVGKRVVDFMSALLDLDPLQRPSAHEALQYWRGIMVEAGLDA